MEIKKFFLSKDNRDNLTGKLCNHLKINDNEVAINSCRGLITRIMKEVFESNQKLLNKGTPQQVIKYMNDETLKRSVKTYLSIRSKQEQMGQLGQYSMKRDREISGKKTKSKQKKKYYQSELPGPDQIGNGGQYAPISSMKPGQYITADGGIGTNFPLGVNVKEQVEGPSNGKKGGGEDLIRRMMEKKMDYENRGGQGNMQNNMAPINNNQMNTILPDGTIIAGGQYGNAPVYGNNQNNQKLPFDPSLLAMDGKGRRQSEFKPDNGEQIEGFTNIGANDMDLPDYQQMQGFQMPDYQGSQQGYQQAVDPQLIAQQFNMPPPNYANQSNQSNYSNQDSNNLSNQMNQMMKEWLNMMQQTTQNMQKNTNQDNIQKTNNELKRTIASQLGVDPMSLLNMNSKQIALMIEKSKKQESESEEPPEEEKPTNIMDKINALLALKGKNVNNIKQLKKIAKNTVKNNSSDEDEIRDVKTYKKKKSKKVESESSEPQPKKKSKKVESESSESQPKKRSRKISESSESEKKKKKEKVESSSENESKITSNLKITKKLNSDSSSESEKQLTTKTFNISSEKLVGDNQIYDYMISFNDDFKEQVSNVVEIKLKKIQIPINPKITSKCNEFIINYSDDILEFELADGTYSLDQIVKAFNSHEQMDRNNIKLSVKYNNIIVEQLDGNEFELDCSKNSLSKLFGFTKKKYNGKSKYISDKPHCFIIKPIYLYFKNISKEEPFAVINPDNTFTQKLKPFSNPVGKLSCLIIQFKTDETPDEKFVNFTNSQHHVMELDIITVKT